MMGGMPQQIPGRSMSVSQGSPQLMSGMPPNMGMPPGQGPQVFGMEGQTWPMQSMDGTMSGAALDAASQDNDNWSSSSRSGPTAPTTLNVEDWYVLTRLTTALGLLLIFIGSNSSVSTVALATWRRKLHI
jgi:hypothetical protein